MKVFKTFEPKKILFATVGSALVWFLIYAVIANWIWPVLSVFVAIIWFMMYALAETNPWEGK